MQGLAAPSPIIWRGRSDGLAFEWSAEGLRVSGGPRPLELSAKPDAYAECESDASYRLLSIVGAVVSCQRSSWGKKDLLGCRQAVIERRS
jgi:hypothetical protein